MKLRGIADTKGRHAEHRERMERDAPKPAQPAPSHQGEPHDGNVKCCGRVYAPHAHAVHAAGGAVHEWRSGVGVVAADCEPTAADLEWERVRLYASANQDRARRAVRVEGAEDSPYPGW